MCCRGVPRRVPVTNGYSDSSVKNYESEPRARRGDNPGVQTKSNGFHEYSGSPGTRTPRFKLWSLRGLAYYSTTKCRSQKPSYLKIEINAIGQPHVACCTHDLIHTYAHLVFSLQSYIAAQHDGYVCRSMQRKMPYFFEWWRAACVRLRTHEQIPTPPAACMYAPELSAFR